MYTIRRSNAKVPTALKNIRFATYSRARSAVIRWLRSRYDFRGNGTSYNPNIGDYGFSVRK